MNGLYANRNSHNDFVRNAINQFSGGGCNAFIAVAFFTEAGVVEKLLASGSHVRLIVRLGFPTSPVALRRLLSRPGVDIRYFTGSSFHPKLYIFGEQTALVGSANLTDAAINGNQEVVVTIDALDQRFAELATLFGDYWLEAKVLTEAVVSEYEVIYKRFCKLQDGIDALGKEVTDKLGSFSPSNIARVKQKISKENLFLESFRKTYQECVSAFNIVRETYIASNYRKADAATIPLRIEIDSFISFVREKRAQKDTWMSGPLRSAVEQRAFISELIEEWRSIRWPHFEERIVGENYPRIQRAFASPKQIAAASDEDIVEALCTLHSFHDRLQFSLGGLETLKKDFIAANQPKRLRDSLSYLVFGSENVENRMANMVYDSTYKLDKFGKANVQELIGWCNQEDLPIINGRTTKVLRYFGSDVRQLGSSNANA